MTPADGAAAARVLREAFGRSAGAGGPGKPAGQAGPDGPPGPVLPSTDACVRGWLHAAAGAWIAELRGYGPVGVVFAVVEPGVGWIAGLGVAPPFRGAGVGGTLADRALQFLRGRNVPLIGLETAPTAAAAAALYARRGLRVCDLTLRLRGPAASVAAALDDRACRPPPQVSAPASQRQPPAPQRRAPETSSSSAAPAAERCAAVVSGEPPANFVGPLLSPQSFVVRCGGLAVVCDPVPRVAAPGGSLEVRAVHGARLDVPAILAGLRAAARAAAARGLSALDVDAAVADGALVRACAPLGFTPVATALRMANAPHAYPAWLERRGGLGRWSF